MLSRHEVVYQLLIPFVMVAFLVLGIVAAIVGIGLIFWKDATLRICASMNRWVSASDSLKPLEKPHDIGPFVSRYRAWFGAILILGGAFALFGLLVQFDLAATIGLLRTKLPGIFVGWIANSLRWILVVGSAVGVAIGAMLLFAPDRLTALAARLDRWYSPPPVVKQADVMHLAPDRWVESHPRLSGSIILVGALIVVMSFGLLLLGR